MTTALDRVAEAYADRDMLAERLAKQNAVIPGIVRAARAEGHPWSAIAASAGVSEVAAYNASRRDA
ncbi:DNA binding protein [Microbacterium phage Nicole72]|uniref:DNA binding protein n=1 Tax=Microbacterium phage Nicole72 TaxID=3062838 RepID=A0ACD4UHU4_9CAUD|nr:DNA binding protein [Microbacterium phage Nicole72]